MKLLAKKIGITLALTAAIAMLTNWPVSAYRATEYKTDQSWVTGTIVGLNNKGALTAVATDSGQYLGVVASSGEGYVDVAGDGSDVTVMATQAGGNVNAGDRLGLSDVAGVAKKVPEGDPAIAVAKSTPKTWKSTTINNNGHSKQVKVALVPAQLVNLQGKSQPAGISYLAGVQQAAGQVAGHPVGLWRAITALAIGLGGLALALGWLFVTSRQSFLSIGRNPMAETTIMHGLWKMMAVSLIILAISFGCSYLILRAGA